MRDARRRPMGWLFYWTLVLSAAIGFGLPAFGAGAPPQSGAGATTVSDTVYLADGTPASGNLIISWPAFVTAGGTAVAAGTTNATLGASGAPCRMPGRRQLAWTTAWFISWGQDR